MAEEFLMQGRWSKMGESAIILLNMHDNVVLFVEE